MFLHKNVRFLTWFNFLLDFRLYSPIMAIYFSRVTGSYALGMSIFSATMLSAAIFELPTGIYSDILGRKKTLVLGAAATLVSVIMYALGASYWILLVGAVLEGLARSLYSGNNDALLHDSLAEHGQEHEYAQYFGKTHSAYQTALAIVAVLGSVIAFFSMELVMWLSVLPAIVGLAISLKIAEPKVDNEKSANIYAHIAEAIKNFRSNARLRKISIATIMGYVKGESAHLFLPVYYESLIPIWAIGVVRFLTHAGAAGSFYYSGKLIKKYGELKMILTGTGYSFVSNIAALIVNSVISPFIIATNSLFYGVMTSAKNTLLQKEYSQAQRSTMGSLNSLAGGILFTLVTYLLGLAADILTPIKALLILQALIAVPYAMWWQLYQNKGINQS